MYSSIPNLDEGTGLSFPSREKEIPDYSDLRMTFTKHMSYKYYGENKKLNITS